MPFDSGGKWFGGIRTHGDGSDPLPPDQYGPPSKKYWEEKAAGERAAAKQYAGYRQLAAQYEAAKKSAGRAYESRKRSIGRQR